MLLTEKQVFRMKKNKEIGIKSSLTGCKAANKLLNVLQTTKLV